MGSVSGFHEYEQFRFEPENVNVGKTRSEDN